jgi:predicted nucleic-acid-binding protein
MIGLDSNVVLRYVVQDDPVQSPVATRLIEGFDQDSPGFISAVTLMETVWVLQSFYDASRQQIKDVVETLLRARSLVVERSDLFWLALSTYSTGNVDFADCVMDRFGKATGCDYTVTFDRKASTTAGMRLLR